MTKKNLYFVIFFFLLEYPLGAENNYHPPLDPPLIVTGTFGEFRGTHFHAGVDFSTHRETGKNVYAIDKGYISRIKVAPNGYGNALYFTLEDGKTAVYGHLDHFNPEIARRVLNKQQAKASSFVDFELTPDELPFNKGDLIAFSGDTGGVPPHLHFELRDANEDLINPLLYGFNLQDTTRPKISSIAFIPLTDDSVPTIQSNWTFTTPEWKPKQQEYIVANQQIPAGKIGVEIAIIDESYGNKCAPVRVALLKHGKAIFERVFKRLSWDDYKNNFQVYNKRLWLDKQEIFERLYSLPNSRLTFQNQSRNPVGVLEVSTNQTQEYSILIEDASHNQTVLKFYVTGTQKEKKFAELTGHSQTVTPGKKSINRFLDNKISLTFDKGTVLYPVEIFAEDLPSKDYPDSEYINRVFHLIPDDLIVQKPMDLTFHSAQTGNLRLYFFNQRKNNWKIIKNQKSGPSQIEASVRDLGTYSIIRDEIPPKVQPIQYFEKTSSQPSLVKFWVEDNLSGVDYNRIQVKSGDKPLIFTMNLNQRVVTVPIEEKGGAQKLKIIVPDYSKNVREITIDLSRLSKHNIAS